MFILLYLKTFKVSKDLVAWEGIVWKQRIDRVTHKLFVILSAVKQFLCYFMRIINRKYSENFLMIIFL